MASIVPVGTTAVSAGFQRSFEQFLQLSPAVNNAILATIKPNQIKSKTHL